MAPPPVAVPVHVTGVVVVGLIVAPVGVEAEALLKSGSASAVASVTRTAAIESELRECLRHVELL